VRARFLHFADCHLGYYQYGNRERYNDFSRALQAVCRAAVEHAVDFVLLAGDLFQKRSIDALTLHHAVRGLEILRDAEIPCIAVEGNHELAYYRDAIGWMRFLAEEELLILLNPIFTQGKAVLPPYQRRPPGAFVEPVPGLRVYGMRYLGASTPQALEAVVEALAEEDRQGVAYTVFMTHAGVEGVLPGQRGGLTHRQLAALRPFVDYLALGHIHKPFQHDHWIFNPGSLETCSMEEVAWEDRGYYLVEVDTDRPREPGIPAHQVTLHRPPRRPFLRLRFSVDHVAGPEDLVRQVREYVFRQAEERGYRPAAEETQETHRSRRPVVELRLSGVLPFDRLSLDLEPLQDALQEAFDPLLAQVKNAAQPAEYAVRGDRGLGRAALERAVLEDLLARDARFQRDTAHWTQVLLNLKRLALDKEIAPEAILAELEAAAASSTGPGS